MRPRPLQRPVFSPRRRTVVVSALVAGGVPSTLYASGAAWPDRPIRMIVSFAAGGSLDAVARSIGESLSRRLGTPVIVNNRAGANGIIGNAMVAHAKPDGDTLLMSTGSFTGSAALYRKLPYYPVRDFVPVTQVARSYGLVLAVGKQVPVTTLKEFIALAKASPSA